MTPSSASVTQSIESTIATPELLREHPELHHYTTFDGLSGIFTSNTLRATHYLDLNDSSEVKLLQSPLTDALEMRFKEAIRVRQRDSLRVRRAVQETGGLNTVAHSMAADLVASLYRVTFDPASEWSLEPFIASFCTHAGEQYTYERENGLLSQWRGYGGGGGYCLVFDTAKLGRMLTSEFDAYYYGQLNVAPVNYAVAGATVEQFFPALLERCESFATQLIDDPKTLPSGEDGFAPFVSGATLYKHQAFREECEVRIAALPGTEKLLKQVQAEHPEIGSPAVKEVGVAERSGRKRRYISLFDKAEVQLPIARIIVGPSVQQCENIDRAKRLVADRVPVIASVTPYVE